jgi:hypothetical protein
VFAKIGLNELGLCANPIGDGTLLYRTPMDVTVAMNSQCLRNTLH